MAVPLVACGGAAEQGTRTEVSVADGAADAARPALQLRGSPRTLAGSLTLSQDSAGVLRGTVAGESVARLLVQRNPRDEAVSRLCAALATGTREPVELPWAWPVDPTAPRLALRTIREGDVEGVRFVVPGTSARYVFEGLTRDGSQRVSVRWPVDADPAYPIPVGAADSVVEASLRPSVFALDSLVAALRFVTPPDGSWPTVPTERPLADARAVTDVRVIPVHPARLSIACHDVTLALPMLARADHMLKIPVEPGDVITANAGVAAGTVRLSFDEAPTVPEPPAREGVTRAAIEATTTGEVTLRVRLQVLPRVQRSRQQVLVRLQRTHPRS